jgi:hypothetical protein
MDDIEARLKRLPLRQPSGELDRRVLNRFAQFREGETPAEPSRSRWAVPLWAAAAMSAAVGWAGFMSGLAIRSERPTVAAEEPAPVMSEVLCQSPAGRNPFDLTQSADPLLPGKPVVSIQISKGT